MITERVTFGDIVEQRTTAVDPIATGLDRYVAIEHLDPGNLTVERWGSVSDGTTFTRRFDPGDVLFSKRRAYQRKAARVLFSGVCSGDLLIFSAKPERLRAELLPFIVQSEAFFQHALTTSAGSLSPRTKWKDLARFELDLPDPNEQDRISTVLTESEQSRADWSAVTEAGRVLRQVFVRELMASAQWPKVPIGQVARVQNGTTPSRAKAAYWADGTIPWLATGKVHEREIRDADEYITPEALDQCSLRVIPAGSVLVAMIGQGKTRGAAAYLAIDATINQNFAAITPGPDINGRFLFHILDASYRALRHASQGSSQGALNCRLVGEFAVPLPSRDQQNEMARQCDLIDRAISAAGAQVEKAQGLQRALTEKLLMESHVH